MPLAPIALEQIPLELRAEYDQLRLALDDEIPAKKLDRNLLVASWSIPDFGDFSSEWCTETAAGSLRDQFSLRLIAEIVSRFDLVVVQRIRGEGRALQEIVRLLGDQRWGMLTSDGGPSATRREDRMAFLFDRRRVVPSGLSCELIVLPGEPTVPWDAMARRFHCTPYAASFVACERPFIVVTAYLRYDDVEPDLAPEASAVASWLSSWAQDEHAVGHNLLLLGDFGIERRGNPCYDAFTSSGLHVPEELLQLPREAHEGRVGESLYDRFAWFTAGDGDHRLWLDCESAGAFDFTKPLSADLGDVELTARLSDHLPLWVEFVVR